MQAASRPSSHWPKAADTEAAMRCVDRFAALGTNEARLAASARGGAMLRALGGNSPYLAELALREPACLRRFLRTGADTIVADAIAAIIAIGPTTPRPRLATAMRTAKRQVALATALADIGGTWDVERVTAALSDLADATLRGAVAHLLRAGHDEGALHLPDPDHPETGSGFVVLGMGKLGARELNYSSDVDLVLLHNPDSGVYAGSGAGAFFTRLARGLVALMEARDGRRLRVPHRSAPAP